MKEPQKEFLVRPLDKSFIKTLKKDMKNHPALCPQPVICLVENVNSLDDYQPNASNIAYVTIGGNHRRSAAMELIEEGFFEDGKTLPSILVFGKS